MPKYLGYAHRIEFPTDSGVFYEPGDNIPNMKKADIAELVSRGHRFEDPDDEESEGKPTGKK